MPRHPNAWSDAAAWLTMIAIVAAIGLLLAGWPLTAISEAG